MFLLEGMAYSKFQAFLEIMSISVQTKQHVRKEKMTINIIET